MGDLRERTKGGGGKRQGAKGQSLRRPLFNLGSFSQIRKLVCKHVTTSPRHVSQNFPPADKLSRHPIILPNGIFASLADRVPVTMGQWEPSVISLRSGDETRVADVAWGERDTSRHSTVWAITHASGVPPARWLPRVGSVDIPPSLRRPPPGDFGLLLVLPHHVLTSSLRADKRCRISLPKSRQSVQRIRRCWPNHPRPRFRCDHPTDASRLPHLARHFALSISLSAF